ETHTRFHVEGVPVAVLLNVLALDILEDQIGLTRRRNAGVHQFGDMRMRQVAQDTTLALESLLADVTEGDAQKLNRHLALETTVVALGQPDDSHPPLTDLREQRVWADGL